MMDQYVACCNSFNVQFKLKYPDGVVDVVSSKGDLLSLSTSIMG